MTQRQLTGASVTAGQDVLDRQQSVGEGIAVLNVEATRVERGAKARCQPILQSENEAHHVLAATHSANAEVAPWAQQEPQY